MTELTEVQQEVARFEELIERNPDEHYWESPSYMEYENAVAICFEMGQAYETIFFHVSRHTDGHINHFIVKGGRYQNPLPSHEGSIEDSITY